MKCLPRSILCLIIFNTSFITTPGDQTISDTIALIEHSLKTSNPRAAEAAALTFLANAPTQRGMLGNALLGLGNRFFSEDNLPDAANTFALLCSLFPQSWTVHYNHAYALAELSRYQEAADVYKRALTINPDNPDIRVQRALAMLACGDYDHGWQEYEWRWHLPDKKSLNFSCKAWDGSSPAGKTLLLISEGASGDIIQFIRYAALLKHNGARIVAKIPEALIPLLSSCPYLDVLISNAAPLPYVDYYASLMSLPALNNTTTATIPCPIPYIHVTPERSKRWEEKILHDPNKLTIGICWHADLSNDANRPLRARRSIPLELFEPLYTNQTVITYSLQQDRALSDDACFLYVHTFEKCDQEGAFIDTAAIMQKLDLVITVDTSIAHLAGALGIPTWVILPAKADWRWMTEGDYSPWYPSMRLFRKTDTESWETLISQLVTHVQLLQKHKEPL